MNIAAVDSSGLCYSPHCIYALLRCIDTFEAYIHFGAGLSFVARSDCMGNAKASKRGTSTVRSSPLFLYICGKRKDTIITDVRLGRVTDRIILLKMNFIKRFLKLSTNRTETYTSDEMIQLASDWTDSFIKSAPKLSCARYQKDEIYMFCCWILIDYGKNYGYLNKSSKRSDFFETIYQAVRNTGNYIQSDFEQFMFRVEQYEWQVDKMLKCDYPRTKMFFPEVLYSRFVATDFKQCASISDREENLMNFSEYLASFWNKVNKELMSKYPMKK